MKQKILDALTSGYTIVFAGFVAVHEVLGYHGYVRTFSEIPITSSFIAQGLAAFAGAWAAFTLNSFEKLREKHIKDLGAINQASVRILKIQLSLIGDADGYVSNPITQSLKDSIKDYKNKDHLDKVGFLITMCTPPLNDINTKNLGCLAEESAYLILRLQNLNDTLFGLRNNLLQRDDLIREIKQNVNFHKEGSVEIQNYRCDFICDQIDKMNHVALENIEDIITDSKYLLDALERYVRKNIPHSLYKDKIIQKY